MNEDTLAQVAQQVLKSFGRAASIDEIYKEIIEKKLYIFNTSTPEHVLRTTIRRHTEDVERVDSCDEILFEMYGDNSYQLKSGVRERLTKNRIGAGMKRIQRANDKEDIITSLMSDQVGIFKEIWKVLLFAAQVGVKNQKREKLSGVDAGKGIDQSTFGNCPAWPGILYLMSLVETQNCISLSGTTQAEDQRVDVFQEYVNGGLTVIKEFFTGRPVDLDGMLAFIDTQKEEMAGKPDLELTI